MARAEGVKRNNKSDQGMREWIATEIERIVGQMGELEGEITYQKKEEEPCKTAGTVTDKIENAEGDTTEHHEVDFHALLFLFSCLLISTPSLLY